MSANTSAENSRRYYERHREEIAARRRERYVSDPGIREKQAARVRERYATDPEYRARKLEANRRYRRKHPERCREYQRRWRELHRDEWGVIVKRSKLKAYRRQKESISDEQENANERD